MTAPGDLAVTWHEANRQHLTAALGRVKLALQLHIARSRGEVPSGSLAGAIDPSSAASDPALRPTALTTLCDCFRLSSFERDLLLLCAGVELDSNVAALCSSAQGDAQRPYPTLSLALAALPDAHWSAITPAAPLRRWRMLEIGSGHALTTSPLRIDERVLHFLTGVGGPDERLAGLVAPLRMSGELAPSHQQIAERIAGLLAHSGGRGAPPLIQLCGEDRDDKRTIAAAACQALGLDLWVMAAEALPAAHHEADVFSRLWQREAALSGGALLIECRQDEMEGSRAAALVRLLDQMHGIVIVARRERLSGGHRPSVAFDTPKPNAAEQRQAWVHALGGAAERLNGQVELLVSQFNLGTQSIRDATVEALSRAAENGDANLGQALWDACRNQGRPRLEDLAQRLEAGASWDDLVLPDAQRQVLRDIGSHVRQRAMVYDRWGFARHGGRGLGISALFAGASGTGKTMAAEVLAGELRLDLYRIDLSSVVSKYIGETEKNLRRIFDAAEEGGAILLFDEADALFGKRSEVRDSHDRYANIEVSYLLQRMECYRGLAILTTNMRSAVDHAFLRRIRFVVQFPFPDTIQRAEIWKRVFPSATPTDGLDPECLAQLNVAGGNIRNIALHAAFLAADAGEPVQMRHVLRAARTEYAKLEKVLTESEIEGWL